MDNHNNPIKRINVKLYLEIFLITLKIGFITFGGGLAMISVFHLEFSEKRKWVSDTEISDITAAAQTLPGIIALNTSVLTAYRVAGIPAAIFAGIGTLLPSFIVLSIVTVFYSAFIENPYVRGALRGISGVVAALFVSTLNKLYKANLCDRYAVIIFIISCALIFLFPSLNIIYIIIGGALAGFILYFVILKKWRVNGND
ncbi:MAG: chromate transporter [Clostridiales bacterium]|nr:chromate transporter [Clostridiales bacterium]